jgi:hypothetical protein
LKILYYVKEASHKRTYYMGFHLREVPRTITSIETG